MAIGSDFDGVRYLPNDIAGLDEVYKLLDRMFQAGWSSEDVAKVTGGNWKRVLFELLPA